MDYYYFHCQLMHRRLVVRSTGQPACRGMVWAINRDNVERLEGIIRNKDPKYIVIDRKGYKNGLELCKSE